MIMGFKLFLGFGPGSGLYFRVRAGFGPEVVGPFATLTPTTDYFHVKTKISKENLRADYYLLLKYLQNLTPKCEIIKVFSTKL